MIRAQIMMNNVLSLLPLIIGCCVLIDMAAAEDAADTHVQEVNIGDTAVLTCRSNDDNHRFQFWLINTKQVLGPKNVIDRHKYRYEVLSGELLIKNVSVKEHGVYTCFCRHISNMTYNVKSIELIVKRNWDDVYDNDHDTNTFRILFLVGMLLLVGALVFILLTLKNDRSAFLRDLEDEEPLAEEDKPSTSYERMISSTYDNVPLDRGFPKEFQTNSSMENV